MKKFIKKALKIASIGISCAAVGLVGVYTLVGIGMTLDARTRYPENYASLVCDVAKNGYAKLWEEVSK